MRLVCLSLFAAAAAVGCGSSTPAQPTPAPTPTPTPTPIVVNAPTLVTPLNGITSFAWPTFTVSNSTHSGSNGALTYRFEISTSNNFTTILISATVAEGTNQTSYTPTSAPPTATTTIYWRVTTLDATNNVTSPTSNVQSFTFDVSVAGGIAAKEGLALWPGTQPPGTPGHAVLGDNWNVYNTVSFDGVAFTTPPIEALRAFDLMDRGMDPQSALNWMNANGYGTDAVYYTVGGGVIGFHFQYMALVNGSWNLVNRVGA